jgi:hypothetical protein
VEPQSPKVEEPNPHDFFGQYELTKKQKVKIIGDPINFLMEGRQAFDSKPRKEEI